MRLQVEVQHLAAAPGKFRDSPGVVPIRYKYVRVRINEAAVCGAEYAYFDVIGIEFVIRPLRFLRIVAEESDRHIVSIEDGNAPFEFRHHCIIVLQTDLARASQVLGHGADIFAIQVEVAQAPVFAVAYQQQRLAISHVESEAVTTIELPFTISFP